MPAVDGRPFQPGQRLGCMGRQSRVDAGLPRNSSPASKSSHLACAKWLLCL